MLLETGKMGTTVFDGWGIMHTMCGKKKWDVRITIHLQQGLELRSDSGIYCNSPETLWTVPPGIFGELSFDIFPAGGLHHFKENH